MIRKLALAPVLMVVPITALLCFSSPARTQDFSAQANRGFVIVSNKCSGCHATTRSDISLYPKAPPLRILGYPAVVSLEEDLAEGIIVGRVDMPQYKFDADEVIALIAYLKYLQEPAARQNFDNNISGERIPMD